ncbi:Fe-S cluster assembly ATPase SufC [Coxiella endosymbiont of Amblyomma sculptum]|uniref:Fe-S cluster assembly ATPase SufC n=1 Tax=Coxiella endosymbiont of Amblyomma sculptum TaxID=2487929 RepID=UPI00132F276D|nr:Fe-S cluster assembly ATPase SufC [Coxiella endosymbiont of Amblyomma sculptum]QHG92527.1 Fe-S cluster assembly ATPase SufC [Coxiella endosymbiont of Amblyomma sculptum]
MLMIRNLCVNAKNHKILRGIELSINAGEVHAVMGPNGSGKSTLASVLAGKGGYSVTADEMTYLNQNLLEFSPERRAASGLFLAFQYPVEIPGVNNLYFLKTAINSIRKKRDEPELDSLDIMNLVKEKLVLLDMDDKFLKRSVNEGFSGGEKKRNEILQMLMLEPYLAILDEIDSGLDIDALQIIARGVNSLRSSERTILLITHYQRLLDYIKPDFVHVLIDGRIVTSGGPSLAYKIEKKGYGWL